MKSFFNFILVIVLLGGIAYFVITTTDMILPLWQGYSSYTSFSKAADIDEFMGQLLTENSFKSIMALALLGSFYNQNENVDIDIVTGSKLTERYKVSEALRRDYNYLINRIGIKGTYSYYAYFNGNSWLVIRYREE